MNVFDFVHLALYALGGRVQGRTKLQKLVFFLGVLTERIDELGYRAHYYGPYSSEVADAINRLVALGFCDRSTVGVGAIGADGFETSRYDYQLNEDGKTLAQAKKEINTELFSKLEEADRKIKEAGDLDYMKLSIAAKTYFMLDKLGRTKRATISTLAKSARTFGWSVTEDQVKDAAKFLESLDLVKIENA